MTIREVASAIPFTAPDDPGSQEGINRMGSKSKSLGSVSGIRIRRTKSKPRIRAPRRSGIEDSKCHQRMCGLLEGIRLDNDEMEEEVTISWGPRTYFTLIFVIIGFVLGIGAYGMYVELGAFYADLEWNSIAKGHSHFPLLKDKPAEETYFGGKRISQVPLLFPAKLLRAPLKFEGHNLHTHNSFQKPAPIPLWLVRSLGLECAALGVKGIGLLFATAYALAFAFVPKVRSKLKWGMILYGCLGILFFLGGTLILTNALIQIPLNYLHMRVWLEDGEGAPTNNVVAHLSSSSPKTIQDTIPPSFSAAVPRLSGGKGKHDDKMNKTSNCAIRSDHVHREELERLLTFAKLCAYRYVTINFRDPCKHVTIPKYFRIPGHSTLYNISVLESLHLCPADGRKMLSISLAFLTALLCWLGMWVLSAASQSLSIPPNYAQLFGVNSMHYVPVSAISDTRARTMSEMPPDMRIVELSRGNSLQEIQGPPPLRPPGSARSASASSIEGICMPSLLPLVTPSVARLVPGPSTQAATGGMFQLNTLMTLVPNMVIHPPVEHRHGQQEHGTDGHSHGHTPGEGEKEGEKSSWFSYH